MTTGKQLPGKCAHCGDMFEFPVELLSTLGDCPNCGKPTKMFLVLPNQETTASRKMVIWAISAIVILIAMLFAAIYAVHLAKRLTEEHHRTAPATVDTQK